MAYFDKETVLHWKGLAKEWLEANTQLTLNDPIIGKDVWEVAHRCGITREAYADRDANDAHIQTALEKIFPNATFQDKKRY